jgi:glycosyltransferase involved in cell wall biosynthesis
MNAPTPPMRVLHIATALTWRGGEQQVAYLFEQLQKQPYKIQQWLFCSKNSDLAAFAQQQKWPVFTTPLVAKINLVYAWRLARFCKQNKIQLLHLHDSAAHGFAALAAMLFGLKTPWILSRRVDFALKKNAWTQYKYHHPSLKRILCVSDTIRKIVLQGTKHVPQTVQTVHSGIDLSRFLSAPPLSETKRQLLRNELVGKEAAAPYTWLIGNVAALAPHKSPLVFLQTAKLLLAGGLPAHFVWIGEGSERSKAQAFIDENHLQKHITLSGFKTNIPEILPCLDLFLMTSSTEGLGTSILDAFACKIPVVATAAGGIPEIVQPEKTGLLAPPENPYLLAQQVLRLLQDPALKNQIIEQASKLVQQFGKQITAQKTLQHYEDVLNNLHPSNYSRST